MKLLVVTDKAVHPPIGGAAIRNWQTINLLMRIGEVATFSVGSANCELGSKPPGVPRWVQYNTAKRSSWQRFTRCFWWVRRHGNPWADLLYSQEISQRLKEMIFDFKPNVIVLEQIWLHRYLPAILSSGCRVVYDAHNCEGRLSGQLARPGERKVSAWLRHIKSSKIQAIERRIVRECDQIWTCSEQDANYFRSLYGKNLDIHVVPNGIDIGQYTFLPRDRRGTCNILFSGTFSYLPNAVAATRLINEIYPRVRELIPNSRLFLVGCSPNQMMQNAGRVVEGIEVTGRIPDVTPYLSKADIVIVPLSEGGGTRLKILEAFAAGVPVVSTSKGAEGIEGADGVHLIIRDDTEELVDSIVKLAEEHNFGDSLRIKARQLVAQKYSWPAIGPKVLSAIEALSYRKLRSETKS